MQIHGEDLQRLGKPYFAIRAAALTLFDREGYEGTSLRKIAVEAGIPQSLIYHYYRDKRELLVTVLESGLEDVSAALLEHAPHLPPERALGELLELVFGVAEKHQEFMRFWYQLRMRRGFVNELEEVDDLWSRALRTRIARILRKGHRHACPRGTLALFLAVDGAAQHFVLNPERFPRSAVTREIVDCFMSDAPAAAA